MIKITKNFKLKLGNHIDCNLVYEKGCCKVQPTIKLCDVGVKNGLGLSLAITRLTMSSPLNFGVYFKPTFLGEYVEANNKITVNDIFGNQSNYYLVDTPKSLYYNYQNNTKLVKETDNATYSYINDDDQSLTISLNGTNYVTSKFRGNPKFAITSNSILSIESLTSALRSAKADFIKDSSGKITKIEVYPIKFDLIGENKKEVIDFVYTSNQLVQIKFTHIDGTLDTYDFLFSSNQWVFSHDQSAMKIEFNFDASNNLISYKEDYIDANRNDFLNSITCNPTHTIIEYPNNKFSYIHFDDNGNSDYEFNDKGIVSFLGFSSYKDDYLINKKSNSFILGKNTTKYVNLAPMGAIISPTNKRTFTKGNSNSKFTALLNQNIPYFNAFNTNIANIVTVDSSDTTAKLAAEISQNCSNKKFVFSTIYNVKSLGSAANFKVKFVPYYNGNAIGGAISKTYSTSIINDYRFICEEVFFSKNVDKILIEISFNSGQKIEFYNTHFIEHPYGETYYRDSNNLIYKTVNNYNVVRLKNHDFTIKNIGFDKVNLFIEKDSDVISSTSTVHLSQYAKKVVGQDIEGNVITEETIYKNGSTEEILQKVNIYDVYSLLSGQIDYNEILTNYSYYLNTDLMSEVTSFDTKTKFTYGDKQINTLFVPKNNESTTLYSTTHTKNTDGLTGNLCETNKTPYSFTYNFMKNLTNCSLGNISVESSTYVDSEVLPKENLSSKTINGQTFDFSYNDEGLVNEIENTTTNSVFGFEYDNLNNVTKVTNSDSSVEQFIYDEDNNLIQDAYKNHKIRNTYESGKNIMKSYDFNDENYQNMIVCSNENTNSEIVNGILTKLADSDRYVGLFDRTTDFVKTGYSNYDDIERFCDLHYKYFSNSLCAKLEYKNAEYNYPIARTGNGLIFGVVYDCQPICYKKFTRSFNNGYAGSIGCLYSLINSKENVCIMSAEIASIYLIKVVSNNTGSYSYKVQIIRSDINQLVYEYDTLISPVIGNVSYMNLNYRITTDGIAINLYTKERNMNFTYDDSIFLPNECYVIYSFNYLTIPSLTVKLLKIGAILADFNQNIPLYDVIEHFNLAYRAYNLSKTLNENNKKCPNSSQLYIYPKINQNVTHLSLKNSILDNKDNHPLNYLGETKIFSYGGLELGNCYYAYGTPLLYQTNLNNKGRICFKSKILSFDGSYQTYLVLYNNNVTIRLYTNGSGKLMLSVNNSSKQIINSSSLLIAPHKIDFSYILSNGILDFDFTIGDYVFRDSISFVELESMDESNFKLLLGCDDQKITYYEIDGNGVKLYNNLFNGFITDLIYYPTDSVSVLSVELQNLYNPIISNTSNDIFGRKNQYKLYYNNKNIINKKFDYVKNDKYVTPLLKEEKILLNSTIDNFEEDIYRKFLYSYETSNNTAPKYKNIYGYEEHVDVTENNVLQVYKRDYEYTEGTNFIKKEIIRKGAISNGEFIESNKWQVDYTYNSNNCLTSVKTTVNDASITTNSFTYSSNFPHLLTYNNSNSFVYDGLYLKQIKNYMGQVIKQFNYRGTKISSIQEPLQNRTIIFDYDYKGRRIKKLIQPTNDLIEYYYDENLLVKEKHSNYSLNFLYNESNELIGFEHVSSNNSAKTKYFYLRNAFNDIVEILDANGNSLVHYLYDAFGNNIEIIDNSSISLGLINPFRYRGYYYDVETQLYWVSSRYYSPELCRWISPDSIEYLDTQSINGLNFYCYCINNPIMYADPSGNFIISIGLLITGFIFGASVGAVSSIIIQGLTDGWQNINGFQVLLDLIIGGISGLLAFSGIGAGGSALLNGGLGFAGSVGGDLIKYNGDLGQVNWIKAAVMAGLNLVLGLEPGVQNSKAIGKSLSSTLSNNAGFKAITKTLSNPKVSARGIQGVFNLYGKSLSQGIYSALGGIISKRMNDSFAAMLSSAVSTSLFEIGVDYFNLL